MYRHWGSVQAVRPIGWSRGILYPFMTTALEWGERSSSRPGLSLPPGKTRYPFYKRLGEPQGRVGQVRKISPPPGFDPRTVQPVASRYTDYSTRPTLLMEGACLFHVGNVLLYKDWPSEVWFPSCGFLTIEVLQVSTLSFYTGRRASEQWLPDSLHNSRCTTYRLRSILYSSLQVLDVTDFCIMNSRLQMPPEIKM